MHEKQECIHIDICFPKGIDVTQVQFSATFSVAPPDQQPLEVNPPSTSFNLKVGVAVDPSAVALVSGGKLPYTYALDANSGSLPTGVDLQGDPDTGEIFLTGTPTVAGDSASPVLLNITDADGATTTLKTRVTSRKK